MNVLKKLDAHEGVCAQSLQDWRKCSSIQSLREPSTLSVYGWIVQKASCTRILYTPYLEFPSTRSAFACSISSWNTCTIRGMAHINHEPNSRNQKDTPENADLRHSNRLRRPMGPHQLGPLIRLLGMFCEARTFTALCQALSTRVLFPATI